MDLTSGEKVPKQLLQKSSHVAVIMNFILAQKGKMSTEWTIVPGELRLAGVFIHPIKKAKNSAPKA